MKIRMTLALLVGVLLLACSSGGGGDKDATAPGDGKTGDVGGKDSGADAGVDAGGDGEKLDIPPDAVPFDTETFLKVASACLRVAACGNADFSVNRCVYWTELLTTLVEQDRIYMLGMTDDYLFSPEGFAAVFHADCINASAGQTNCDSVRMCLQGNGGPDTCKDAGTAEDLPRVCAGDKLIACTEWGAGLGYIPVEVSCDWFGGICAAMAGGGASVCTGGKCDTFGVTCEGDDASFCVAPDPGNEILIGCGMLGAACNPDALDFEDACIGTGAACDPETFADACQDGKVRTCIGGKIADMDCSALPGWTCTEQTGPEGGKEVSCYHPDPLCGELDHARCKDGLTIEVCYQGQWGAVSCPDLGLAGCEENAENGARCL